MERSNYALISALYVSKTRGLYSDIYFPIIKYAIVKLYASQTSESQHYATLEMIQEVISNLFGINIPSVVISMTLKKIDARPSSTIKLNLYSDNSFQILSAMFDEDERTYDEKEHEFNAHIIEIETAFKRFLETEEIPDEGIRSFSSSLRIQTTYCHISKITKKRMSERSTHQSSSFWSFLIGNTMSCL